MRDTFSVNKMISKALRSKATQLNLSGRGLKVLPERLCELTQLQVLYIANNELENLPESLGALTQLHTLGLSNNKLVNLPESLSKFTKLQILDLSDNRIMEIPKPLSEFKRLHTLDISGNLLNNLPESLGELTQLQSLNISRNKLTYMPNSLRQLIYLRKLYLSTNQLTELPKSLGELRQLQRLYLSNNRLINIPASIGELTHLESLDLSCNKLMNLPESLGMLVRLQKLYLSSNLLTELPESLGNLNLLNILLLHDNEALRIPLEILGPKENIVISNKQNSSRPRSILTWYFQTRVGMTKRLNEAKMLLVGQGGVGKTSLAHYLINNKPCNLGELPTEGINIDDWFIQGKINSIGMLEKINVHVWDFGGQEIMHATHQFFLTRRSLYLLVIDARAGEKESNIHYWLKIIQSYGGESPVIVVVNKCDQHPHELNETRLIRDYPNIRGFIQTSCTTGQGIAELRREIGKHTRRLPHVFDELPKSYFEAKAELERVAAQENYLPIEEYRQICRRHSIEKYEDQDLLIRFLHDLGVVLNFQDPDDPYGQNDPFVLNPEWVTGGVYAIVNDNELKGKRDGLLTCQKLSAILNSLQGYPKNRHAFIVRKMMQFELAYRIDNGKQSCWLIPELLDPKEPKDLQWDPERSLNFQYAYPVLPAGIICRFIVRIHHYVDPKNSWRSGAVLMIDSHKVLVRGDTEKNKVFIAVQGPVKQRKEILAIVRDAFRYVHSTIPALSPKEEVPLPDKPNIAVEYDYLLELEDLGERFFVPPGAGKRYSVTDLLKGVDSDLFQDEYLRRIQKEEKIMKKNKYLYRIFTPTKLK